MTLPVALRRQERPCDRTRYLNERAGQNAPTGEHLQYGSQRRGSAREPRAVRIRRTEQKPATTGPPPAGSEQPSRPAPLRGEPAAAGVMAQPRARRAPPAPPETAGSSADVRRLEATGRSRHRQNYVGGYVFDRRDVRRPRAPSPPPYVEGGGYSGFTWPYMYICPSAPECLMAWQGRQAAR